MRKTAQQMHDEYGFPKDEAAIKYLQEHHIHPVLEKHLKVCWEIDNVYGLVQGEQISTGKARELVAAIIEKNYGTKNDSKEGKIGIQVNPKSKYDPW